MTALILGLNPVALAIFAVGILVSLWAAAKVKSTFARYEQVRARSGVTGAQVAHAILRAHGIHDVRVEPVQGRLSDHYDPRNKVLRLSEPVYHHDSVAALGVAAHEVGHAIQHAHGYGPLKFRSAWVPVAGIGAGLGELLILVGIGVAMASGGQNMLVAWIGVVLFSTVTIFTLITLPVEFDASRRALVTLADAHVLDADEIPQAKKVLDAAALTYVAAAAVSMMNLLYYVWLLTGMTRRED